MLLQDTCMPVWLKLNIMNNTKAIYTISTKKQWNHRIVFFWDAVCASEDLIIQI
jgi:hypothetical protein